MKSKLRTLARKMSTWPVIGRFARIIVAVIRLPEERAEFRKLIAEQAVNLQKMADQYSKIQSEQIDLSPINEQLAKHQIFITSQVPRLAQKMAELNRINHK